MPIFDYRCTHCDMIYDILHKGKELSEDIVCPHCGSHQHTKLISLPSIITKGSSSMQCNQKVCRMEQSCCGDKCSLGEASEWN
jgi:putative FmdB family regulatory protein